MTKRCLSLLAMATAATLGLAASANATVYIKATEPFNPFYVEETSGPSPQTLHFSTNFFGKAGISSVSASQLAGLFSSQGFPSTASCPCTQHHGVDISVSATDQTNPLGFNYFESRFFTYFVPYDDSDLLHLPWTVQIDTYLDPANQPYGTTTPLGSAIFQTAGGAVDVDGTVTNAPTGPYSITAIYRILSDGPGEITFAASVALIPEPTSTALLGAALAGWGILAQRRRMAA